LSSIYAEEAGVSGSRNAWDEIFASEGRFFVEPHQDMPGIVQLLRDRGASTILDLGSGTGRHVVYLAGHNFDVCGLDCSREGWKPPVFGWLEKVWKLTSGPRA
jgi:tRNA G46 methylase TrmB